MMLLTMVLGLLYGWICLRLSRVINQEGEVNQTAPDGLSVIIPFRDEEERLPLILGSLSRQDLPDCPVEVIFVDDGSADRSTLLIKQATLTGMNLRLIVSEGDGKPAALETGRHAASYSWLVTTDADMILPPGWLKNLVAYTDDKTDLVCGVTLAGRAGFAGRLQTLETTLFMIVAVGMHRLGYPLSATGNSMAFRASTLETVGGFQSVQGSPREDYALYQRFADHGATIRYRSGPMALAETPGEPSLKAWLRQRRRWFGSPFNLALFPLFSMLVFASVWFLFAFGLMAGMGWIALTAFGFKLTGNMMLIRGFEHHTGHRMPIQSVILFELVWVVPLFLLLVNRLINPVVVWKGRRYR